jgi:hypothetical protein
MRGHPARPEQFFERKGGVLKKIPILSIIDLRFYDKLIKRRGSG